jgi:DNA-binding PadR family transcriptional regulator
VRVTGIRIRKRKGPTFAESAKIDFVFFVDTCHSITQYGVIRHVVLDHMEPLPMTEPVLLILLSLADRPRHGYAILQDTEKMSDGRVRLSTGTLYGALRRLLDEGWIARFQEEDNSRGKQAYRLTSLGQRNLQQEVNRLKHLTRVASVRVARKEM